ncbi:MAG: helix-turn-helix domain-containing protein [Clostridia bacterium]|nr:helix-turn-helix domain-containing protein [Clostridia bacterium]
MEKKTIGSFISALRRAAGMTQRDLAEQLNVSDKAVSRWERDESAPDLTLLPLIADLFGITVDELLRGQRKANTEVQPLREDGESVATSTVPPSNKRQKMLFGNRLRKQKMLNYIPLGLFAAGVIAALLCNFAFTRAALGFFLGLLFEVGAVVCALAFAGAAMPVTEEDYDPELLQGYKRDVIRTAYLPVYLALVTLPMFLLLLIVWASYGPSFGFDSTAIVWLLILIPLWALLTREIGKFAVLPRIDRRFGVQESERETERRRGVGRLAKKCAIVTACAMILPVIAMCVLTCGAFDPDTDFVKGTTFDNFEDFAAHMASEGRFGTTDDWGEWAFECSTWYYTRNSPEGFFVNIQESVPMPDPSMSEGESDEQEPPRESYSHRVITDEHENVIVEFDWINADVVHIDWSFDQSEDGMPATVYTAQQLRQSHSIYDTLVLLLGILIAAVPLVGIGAYVVKRRRV